MTREEIMLKLQNGLLGTPDNYGGLLDARQMQGARGNGLMNFGASLLAASGPSATPTSFGQAFGQAALQGRSAQGQAVQDALNASLLKRQLAAKERKPLMTVNAGDTVYDPNEGKAVYSAPGKPQDPQSALAKLNADFLAERMSPEDYNAAKKLLLTAKTGTTVNVNNASNKLGETMAAEAGKQYATQFDAAQMAPEAIASSQRVRNMLALTPYTGTGAEWKLALGKAAKAAGFDYAGDDIENTELLAKELGQNVLNSVKSSGLAGSQGLTEGERKFLLQVVGGTITLDDKTLGKIADLNERVARNSIKKWNAVTERLPADILRQLGMGPVEETPGGAMGDGWSIVK